MRLNKIILFIFTILILIYLILLFNQYKFIKRAENFEKQKKYIYAIDYYSYVLLSYTPFSPFIKNAQFRILKLAEKFNRKKDLYGALFAYEILRSSYFQVKSIYQPEYQLIKLLNKKIAQIKSQILVNEARVKDKKEAYNAQLKILKYNSFSAIYLELISVFSLILWILMIFLYFLYKKKLFYKIYFILFFLTWIVSLYY